MERVRGVEGVYGVVNNNRHKSRRCKSNKSKVKSGKKELDFYKIMIEKGYRG